MAKKASTRLSEGSKFKKVMKEWKAGELNIGKSDKKVKSKKQAVAIGLDEQRRANKKKSKKK